MGATALFLVSGLLATISFLTVINSGRLLESQQMLDHKRVYTYENTASEELLKAELVASIYNNNYTTQGLIKDLSCYFVTPATCPLGSLPAWEHRLVGNLPIPGLPPNKAARQMVAISDPTSIEQYVDYQVISLAPPVPGFPPIQPRTVRLTLGQALKNNNALTVNRGDCVFCHATLYGNFSQYQAPQWWVRNQNRIHGSFNVGGSTVAAYANSTDPLAILPGVDSYLPVAADPNGSDAAALGLPDYVGCNAKPAPLICPENGPASHATTVKALQSFYQGPSLPWNVPRQSFMLPKFDPNSALLVARGSLTAASPAAITVYPYSGGPGCAGAVASVTGVNECNVVINARDGAPVTIAGNVFFRGDVIIFGKVQGIGSIFSGRNIYIADSLSYVHSPPQFSGTAAGNATMDNVSANGPAIAAAMLAGGYDQLNLFATNNIVIGDPYAEYEPGFPPGTMGSNTVSSDLGYINRHIFSNANYASGQAREASTGYMLDSVGPLGGGGPCYVYPWGSSSACVANYVPPERWGPLVYGSVPDSTYYNSTLGSPLPPAYVSNLLPKNPTATPPYDMADWITLPQFVAWTRNAATFAAQSVADGLGRMPRFKTLTFPVFVSAGGSIYNTATYLPGAATMTTLESYMGAFPPAAASVHASAASFIDACWGVLQANAGAFDHTGNWNTGFVCVLNYAAGPPAQTYARIYAFEPSFAPNSYMYFCADGTTRSTPFGMTPTPATSCAATGATATPADIRDFIAADFSLQIYFSIANIEPRITVATRYWDQTKLRVRNRVQMIEANLFANYFVSFADDSIADRQLRIHGSVLAHDVLGRLANNFGSDRSYAGTNYQNNVGDTGSLQEIPDPFSTASLGVSPSVIIYQDPRFDISGELVHMDYAKTLFRFQ